MHPDRLALPHRWEPPRQLLPLAAGGCSSYRPPAGRLRLRGDHPVRERHDGLHEHLAAPGLEPPFEGVGCVSVVDGEGFLCHDIACIEAVVNQVHGHAGAEVPVI